MDTTSFPLGRTDPSDQVSTAPGAFQFGWFECDGVADGFELALESAGAVLG
jgi:hypothetical protein